MNGREAQVQATTKGQEEDDEDVTSLAEKSQTLSLNEAQEEPSSLPEALRASGTRKFKVREAQQKPPPPVMTTTGSIAAALRVSRKRKTFSLSELTDIQAKKALALFKKSYGYSTKLANTENKTIRELIAQLNPNNLLEESHSKQKAKAL